MEKEGSAVAISYDYYRIFYYVAKYHSFTRAAKVLMNSQPNITRTINNLESELGCRLFLRSRTGVVLTPEGEQLFSHVQIAQEHLQAGETSLLEAQNLISGHLSVSASEIALHLLLLPVLQKFHQAYPGVHIRVSNHSSPQAISAVKNGASELAVITGPTNISKPLTEKSLLSFRDVLVAGPGFSSLQGRTLSLEELKHYPIISLGRESMTFSFYDRFFSAHGQLFQPAVEAATADQILPLVRYDLGLGFLPEAYVMDAIARGEVFPVSLQETIPCREVTLILDKSRPLSAASVAFKQMLSAH